MIASEVRRAARACTLATGRADSARGTFVFAGCLAISQALAAPVLDATPLDLPGQSQPSVVADPQGGYVLTWIDRAAGRAQLRFAQLDGDGRPTGRGDIADGTDWFVNWADFPSLAIADNGDWLTYFLRRSDATRPYAYDVLTTRSTDRGASWSTPALLHDDGTTTEHGFVSLLPDGGDRVLALWLDGRRSGGNEAHDHDAHGSGGSMTLRSAVLARDGAPAEPLELDPRTCDCCGTDAVRTSEGPLVVYRDRSADEVRDISWLLRTGRFWSEPVGVHADGWQTRACPVNGPALAVSGSNAVVAWTTLGDDALQVRVAARAAASSWSAPRTIDRGAAVLGRVDLAPWRDDGLLLTWVGTRSDGDAGDGHALRVAWLGSTLEVLATRDIAQIPTGRSVGMPRLASQGTRAVLVWTEADASASRVRGVLLQAARTNEASKPAPPSRGDRRIRP